MNGWSRALAALGLGMAMLAAGCGTAGVSARPRPSSPPAVTAPARSRPPTTVPPTTVPPPSAAPTPAPTASAPAALSTGMTGPAVLALQQRLAALEYYPGPTDGSFGPDTLEAVWAFQEAQGLPVTGTVGPATSAALANPRTPAVLVPDGGATRVEINLADEVLVLYRAGQIALISHVSTGGGYYYCSPGGGCAYAITPTGDFQTTTFMPGWVTVPLGEMYNPVFFIDTAFAIHGDTYVPLQPVSHGCVRIPMDIAQFFYTLVPTPGTPVYIRG